MTQRPGMELVEQDQGRLIADQVDPILLVRGDRGTLVEVDKRGRLAKLACNVTPQMVVPADRPSGDGGHLGNRRLESFRDFLGNERRSRNENACRELR
jgi:hypothetical protein